MHLSISLCMHAGGYRGIEKGLGRGVNTEVLRKRGEDRENHIPKLGIQFFFC